MYYLQSRYYDPEVGRFINADAYTSTGQGILGTNMFAYCGNNPVCNSDPSGYLWIELAAIMTVIAVCLTGCSQSEPSPRRDLANAPDLDITTASNSSYNCYGNAIGKQIDADPTGYTPGDSAKTTFEAVQRDLGGEANCIKLDSYDSPIEDGWYVVAMMCGETDYHFIRLDANGWYNKSGNDARVGGCYIPESYVHTNTWYAIGEIGGMCIMFNGPGDPVYTSESGPLYFAVRSGWDD